MGEKRRAWEREAKSRVKECQLWREGQGERREDVGPKGERAFIENGAVPLLLLVAMASSGVSMHDLQHCVLCAQLRQEERH